MCKIRRKKTFKTLAIIGNGFDMAHGYATDYRTFAESTSSPYLEQFKEYCDKEESITTWYWFEDNIRILTEKLLMQSFTGDCDFDINRKEIDDVRTIFRGIHDLLITYLQNELEKHPLEKKTSISKYLTSKSFAINFNYTNTVEPYTKNIFYVHGSLAENDILLGYDYRDEPCLAQYEDMCWSKTLCREALSFRRHLRKKKILKYAPKKYNKLLSGLETYQHWENTGRGIDEEVETLIPKFQFIDRLMKKLRKANDIPNIDYAHIGTLLIIGHGIEADSVYLDKILSQCENVGKVVLYRFKGESEQSIVRKRDFLSAYFNDIDIIYY